MATLRVERRKFVICLCNEDRVLCEAEETADVNRTAEHNTSGLYVCWAKYSGAEQSGAEQSKAEQNRAEQSRAERSGAEHSIAQRTVADTEKTWQVQEWSERPGSVTLCETFPNLLSKVRVVICYTQDARQRFCHFQQTTFDAQQKPYKKVPGRLRVHAVC